MEENSTSSPVREKLTGLLVRAAFLFEPLAPTAISYYLGRKLNELKQKGLISDYKTRTCRLGKFHYRIDVDLDVNSKQAIYMFNDLLPNQLNGVRRWFNV
ncbi:hypothetical protein G4O51_08575 [Candidatus Bathyarchaeota archaeon A05DMB-2]|jgi:hypothetical protein|nr:hypothetical protein [Candidatus Bathyarchaeota archaeon A05DMB-2]